MGRSIDRNGPRSQRPDRVRHQSCRTTSGWHTADSSVHRATSSAASPGLPGTPVSSSDLRATALVTHAARNCGRWAESPRSVPPHPGAEDEAGIRHESQRGKPGSRANRSPERGITGLRNLNCGAAVCAVSTEGLPARLSVGTQASFTERGGRLQYRSGASVPK